METSSIGNAPILGLLLCVGFIGLGFQIGKSLIAFRALVRAFTVKGLSAREVNANVAIWPITFNQADNELDRLYADIQKKTVLITTFLTCQGFPEAARQQGRQGQFSINNRDSNTPYIKKVRWYRPLPATWRTEH